MGLRESKKQHTREQIASEAMRLFVTKGFEHVTVAEVAAAANVSEKTVFNYFPTKEDLFFDEVPARLAAQAVAIRNRRPGQSVLAALHEHHTSGAARMTSEHFAHIARVIEESPELRAKELEVMSRMADALAEALRAELRIPELEAHVAANAITSVHWQFFRDARRQALAGRHGPAAARRLRDELRRAYALLERGLGDLEHAP